ncbi:MAG: ABC transporter permease [Deltaproteobacteria bacterium]|nr:ABC transporter permease [Deltaproteobacteria bacterium]
MSSALYAVMRKEFRQMTRDKRMMALLILAPTLQLFVLGFAANYDVDRIETATCDSDRTAASRALRQGLLADGTFIDVGPARDCRRPGDDIRDGRAKVVLVIPDGYARDLASGRTADVQVLVDGTNPVIGRYASSAASTYLNLVSARRQLPSLAAMSAAAGAEIRVPTISVAPRVLYNPAMRSAIFMVPGVSAMVLLIVTTIATAMGLAREREMGTLEQVMVTPISRSELLLGKVMPFVIVGLFDVLLALVVGTWVFHVPVRGSLAVLGLGTCLYLLSTVGVGLLISTVSRTQQQAIMGGFFVMMPAILLSGVMTPIENMPGWLQPVTWLNPVRFFVEILRGVLLKGAGVVDLWIPFVALAAFGPAVVALAVGRFRKRLA